MIKKKKTNFKFNMKNELHCPFEHPLRGGCHTQNRQEAGFEMPSKWPFLAIKHVWSNFNTGINKESCDALGNTEA